MDSKNRLLKNVWQTDSYYQKAKEGSLQTDHIGMIILKRLSKKADKVLDLGCGEGSRLNQIVSKGAQGYGIDISKRAIQLAKKTYPKLHFINADIEGGIKLDLKFDIVYSAYVLEHLTDPASFILNAIKLISDNGCLVLIAPNYGAPNRCSPPYKNSRIKKLLSGFLKDIFILFINPNINKWQHVKPIADKENYQTDWDTTIEPYINTLIVFLRKNDFTIEYYSSCWSEEMKNAKLHQKIFRYLGEKGIYPFNLWGPHLVVVARHKYE